MRAISRSPCAWREHELAGVEGLRVTLRRVALDSAQPQQGTERVLAEPPPPSLRDECTEQVRDLALHVSRREWHEHVRHTEVPVVLRDLELEDHLVAKRVPGELGDEAVVLVQVAPEVREDQPRPHGLFERLEALLGRRALMRQEAVAMGEDPHALLARPPEEAARRIEPLAPPPLVGAEHEPVHLERRVQLEEAQERPAAADLDVVAMRPDAEHAPRRVREALEVERPHRSVRPSIPARAPGRSRAGPRSAACP